MPRKPEPTSQNYIITAWVMAFGLCGYTAYWIWAGSDWFVVTCFVIMDIWAFYSVWNRNTWSAYYVVIVLAIMFLTAILASFFDDDELQLDVWLTWVFLAVFIFIPFPTCIIFWYCWGKECDRVERQPLPGCLMPAEGWDAEKGDGDKARMTQASEKGASKKKGDRMTQATSRTRAE